MSLYLATKSFSNVVNILGLVTISNLVFINSVAAFNVTFSNGGFESSTTGWSTIGDVNTTGTFDGISPRGGSSSQAIITNAYNTTNRIDDVDSSGSSLSFNQSGTNPVDADTITDNHTGQDLQTFLGLSTDSLSIDRNPVVTGNPRTSKEGSGIFQDITIEIDPTNTDTALEISFNWAYLTNDGTSGGLGNQDFAFWTIGTVDGGNYTPIPQDDGDIDVLADSSGIITAPTTDDNFVQENTSFYEDNSLFTYNVDVTGLTPGTYTYRVGFGVVDVDGSDRSSALLIDNFDARAVPFEFSPGLGLLLSGAFFGSLHWRRLRKNSAIKIQDK